MRKGVLTAQPDGRATHQQALPLLRDFDALQRIRPYLVPSSLAYRRLEREQARMETALETLRRHARASR